MMNCDPVTGTCLLPAANSASGERELVSPVGAAVHYVGDPMCSWCWGISPVLAQVAQHCERQGLPFTITMWGLRVGGGDPWVPAFKNFLRSEWSHIAQVTGQPFGFKLLDWPHFDYDTEPACRAVVLASDMLRQRGRRLGAELAFFSAVQRKFYVDGEDPKDVKFYRSLCGEAGLPFEEFEAEFTKPQAFDAVSVHFNRCRQWGVRAFPTLLLEKDGVFNQIGSGSLTAQAAIQRIDLVLSAASEPSR
jgi:putative protein-disulfide isomerase